MTRQYEVTFETTREEAERRASNGAGEVTPEGNYRRTTTLYALVEYAREDPEASVRVLPET